MENAKTTKRKGKKHTNNMWGLGLSTVHRRGSQNICVFVVFMIFWYFPHFTWKSPKMCVCVCVCFCVVVLFVASLVPKVLNILPSLAFCFSAFWTFRKIRSSDFRNGLCVNSYILYLNNFPHFVYVYIYIHTHILSMRAVQWVCTSSVASSWGHADHATLLSF